MSVVLLDTSDIGEAEVVIGANFTRLRMSAGDDATQTCTRVVRSNVGPQTIDEFDFSYVMSYETEPPDQVFLCRVRSGVITTETPHRASEVCRAGEVAAFGAVYGRPMKGTVDCARYDILLVERGLFSEVAAGSPRSRAPVQLIGEVPISAVANRHVSRVIDAIRAVARTNPDAAENSLIAGAMQRQLAASMLAAFPNTALLNPTIEDRRDSTPVLLRRAIAFIEDNVRFDISLAEIARAVFVTPRALQYMFRRHLDCTPMEYLRRVRLHHAHHDLIRLSRPEATVSAIATWWGFAHVGRFSVYYRLIYGQSPHVTLDS